MAGAVAAVAVWLHVHSGWQRGGRPGRAPWRQAGLTTLVVSIALLALTGFAWSRFVAAVARAGATPAPTRRALAHGEIRSR